MQQFRHENKRNLSCILEHPAQWIFVFSRQHVPVVYICGSADRLQQLLSFLDLLQSPLCLLVLVHCLV